MIAIPALIWLSSFEMLSQTNVFERPNLYSAVLIEPGKGFYLNLGESQLVAFDFQTDQLRVHAGSGSGPGDLSKPFSISLVGDRLFIQDANGFQIFSREGHFQERIKKPIGVNLRSVPNGWLALTGMYRLDREKPLQAKFMNLEMTSSEILGTWSSEASRGAPVKPRVPILLNPVQGLTLFRTDRTGRYAYVLPEKTDKIHIFDLEKRQEISVIVLPVPRYPFDEEWGMAEIELHRKLYRENGWNVPVEPDFPSFFPAIKQFVVTPENRVVVIAWQPTPVHMGEREETYDADNTHAYTVTGQPLKLNDLDVLWNRLVHIDGDQVYLWGFNPEADEYTLARCRRDALKSVLPAFPITDTND